MTVKVVKYFFVLLVYFLFVDTVSANTICDKDEFQKMKIIAEDIDVTYNYVVNDEVITELYDIYLNGSLSNFYIILNDSYEYVSSNGTEITFRESNLDLKIEIYIKGCNKIVRTINLKLPAYNTYSMSEECEKLKKYNLEICNEWYNGEVNDEIFHEIISQYNDYNQKEDAEYYLDYSISDIIRMEWKFIFVSIFTLFIIILIIIRYKKRSELK